MAVVSIVGPLIEVKLYSRRQTQFEFTCRDKQIEQKATFSCASEVPHEVLVDEQRTQSKQIPKQTKIFRIRMPSE